jgi:hypothetical protein
LVRYAVVEILPVRGGLRNGPPEGVLYAANVRSVKLNGHLPRHHPRILY